METRILDIELNKEGKMPYLTDILPQIESNTIFCKTLTGLGATYSEIKALRHSIIVEPNTPPIIGKSKDPIHKEDNVFAVLKGVTTEDIVEYIEQTLSANKLIKIITTPESFAKVKKAFEELELDMYIMCFLLFDECDKLIKDVDYRQDIIIPIDDFFLFTNKALVSATPILPSDPNFEKQKFKVIRVNPLFEYKRQISIIETNNVLEALKQINPLIVEQQTTQRSICFFINSTDMIYQLIDRLNIADESVVFCSEKSVEKLKKKKFKSVYENWDIKHKKLYMFFTSRFYSAVDIILDEKPDVVFVTEPYFAEYTIIDPCTDAIQAIGRFRNGASFAIHLINTNENYPIRTKSGVEEYLKGCRDAYKAIKNIYNCATSVETRNAYKAALDILPFNNFLKDNKTNYFAIDNYVDDSLVKSGYNNINSVIELYKRSSLFIPEQEKSFFYKLGDKERLKLENNSSSIKEKRQQIVELLEIFKDERDLELTQSYVRDLRNIDPFIVDAYDTVGKEVIELNNYSFKRIKEAMILKSYREKTSGVEFIQLLTNSFHIGQKYTCEYTKKELIRLYEILNISPKKSITAKTINDYFETRECKMKNKRAIRIIRLQI
jgi:hypothetical protein